MDGCARTRKTVALVERSGARTCDIADPRGFAWEILRRRADYRATAVTTEWIDGAAGAVELIRATETTDYWGLRFRRGA